MSRLFKLRTFEAPRGGDCRITSLLPLPACDDHGTQSLHLRHSRAPIGLNTSKVKENVVGQPPRFASRHMIVGFGVLRTLHVLPFSVPLCTPDGCCACMGTLFLWCSQLGCSILVTRRFRTPGADTPLKRLHPGLRRFP